jgi:alpha-amylase
MKVPVKLSFSRYWARDWTALDPNFGTKADLANLVKSTCSRNKNRPDGVINHTGPITETDVAWPNYWVRTSPV